MAYPLQGVAVDEYGNAKTEEGLLALKKQEEEEENESGFDPMRAAALSAGASLLRNSGWSRNPMSLGESIGHAIPAGMQGYYNQDAHNQNEQASLYERQQAEQEALNAKLKVEDDIRIQEQDQESFSQMMNELGLSVTEQKTMLRFYMKNPKEASSYLAKKIMDKDTGKTKILTPEQIKENNLEAGQMYQQKPNGTISVLPSARKEGTWKFMTTAEKDEAGLPVKEVWQRNDSGGIKKADIGETTTKKNTFRENIAREQPDGIFQMRKILFDEKGAEVEDLGPSELLASPPKDQSWDYPNKLQFQANPKLKNLPWPDEASTAALDGSGELRGFYTEAGAFIPTGVKSIELELAQDRVDIAANTLELSEDKFIQQQDNYRSDGNKKMWQQARENKWTEGRVKREEYAHQAKMAQMAKNFEDKTSYISKEEFLKENDAGDTLPKGVAFVEMADGKITKYLNKDFSTWVEPLDRAGHELVKEELATLYKEHEFSADEKHIIRGLRLDGDHMEALKKAHDFMQSQGKLIPAPASILKKYQSDAVVVKHAQKALGMLNDPDIGKIIKANAGFWAGRLTEKAKHPLYQEFVAIATAGTLQKRHDLIGSQMTDGELKFTEPMFVSPHDTADSLRVKLKTLLADASYNLELTHNMFSAEAGYNDKVWTEKKPKLKTAGDLEK